MVSAPPKHPNEFEHTENIAKFLGFFILYGLIGGFLGRAVDYIIVKLQKDRYERPSAFFFACLHIALNGMIFFAAFKLILFKRGGIEMTFDDWMSSTFQGLIFGTTLYSVQEALTKNFQRLVKT